jgi:4-alpha-glucanotransferase
VGPTVSLSLVVHNHQPVGNFGWVIEDVFDHAYQPMLDALERHARIRLGLHYTGPLLQWMVTNRPAAVDQIRVLVSRGQIEIVGGGFYEPILITLPDRDRNGQLVRMADELEGLFGRRPRGAWLAERVWEPSLAKDLAAAGYEWTVLDDNHLRAASIKEDAMWTSFTTDDRGLRLTVFGTEQGLRYRIPFRPVEDVIGYLRDRATPDGRNVGMMGDDGEKFGSWPGTYEYCWSREHWVDRMFEALEANDEWLKTVKPSEWIDVHPPTTRVYFPTASYVEMTEWVLPPDETPVFVDLLETARARNDPAARFLRGGFWRNYAARYREINELHKQMLRVSDKVATMAPGPERDRALDHLYQGQSNDCYWHGLFGGIYIVHMRMATIAHLIAAEDLADEQAVRLGLGTGVAPYATQLCDTDLDAIDEVLVASPGQTLILDLAEGGAISSWDLRASRVALTSVMRRRPEAYHARLVAHETQGSAGSADAREAASGGPKTIHDIVSVKEPGLSALLHYDDHERRSGLVHLLAADSAPSRHQFVTGDYHDLGDFLEGGFEPVTVESDRVVVRRSGCLSPASDSDPVVVTKTYRFDGGRMSPMLELETAVENTGDRALEFELAVEWNLNVLGGGHNPAAYYEPMPGTRTPHDVDGELEVASSIAFGNDFEGVRVVAHAEPEARLTWFPVETVSNSEAGFERSYQGSCLLFRWRLSLEPGTRQVRTMRFDVAQTHDRSAEERG